MKSLRMISFIVVVMMMFTAISCKKEKAVSVAQSETTLNSPAEVKNQLIQPEDVVKKDVIKTSNLSDTNVSAEKLTGIEIFPSYQIIRSTISLRKDGGQTLFILVPKVDLKLMKHVIQIKNLIKLLVVTEKRPENISMLIFDDLSILEEVYSKSAITDLNVASHYLAKYEATPAKGVYQNTLIIFPFAPSSNSAITAKTDIIDFNPYNW
jgi:hypothetical protein